MGTRTEHAPGTFTWNELHTPDPDRALDFYTNLFGWNSEDVDTQGDLRYTIVKVGERSNSSVTEAQGDEPPYWLPYFTVEDRDATAERATALGAREIFRMDLPQGSFAGFSDPQVAVFAVFAGEVDDWLCG